MTVANVFQTLEIRASVIVDFLQNGDYCSLSQCERDQCVNSGESLTNLK